MASRLNESTSSSLRTFPWWFERIVGNGMILRSLRHFRLENYDLEHVANVTGLDPNATLTFIVSIPQSTVSRSSPGSGISHMDLLILH
jgi:hypothetical protein